MSSSPHDLPQALDHVLYEMEMLHDAAALTQKTKESGSKKNAYLESFVLHARCLEEFFCKTASKDPQDDTMQPHHFAKIEKQGRSAVNKRMHKEVAHLTYDRKKSGEIRGWDVESVLKEVAGWALPFLNAVQKDEALMKFENNALRTSKQITFFTQLLERPKKLLSPQQATATTTATTSLATYIAADEVTMTCLPVEGLDETASS